LKKAVVALLLPFLACGCAKAEKPIHPDFTLTASSFKEMAARLPEASARLAMENPARFLTAMEGVLSTPPDLLILVDKSHDLSRDAVPVDLVSLSGYPSLRLNKKDLLMRKSAADALTAMSDSARKDGIVLDVTSTYRTYAYQETLFEWNLKTKGREVTEREIAKPGRSQHQLGTVADFGSTDESYHGTPAALWLEKNAEDFGFSLSYPKGREAETGYVYESWHYRYVGTAAVMMIRGFFAGSQQAFLSWFAAEGEAYRGALKPTTPKGKPEGRKD
jgi:zinc D-Ala-D-Ala carboxypeptidase